MKTALVLSLLITTISAIHIKCDYKMSLISRTHGSLYTCSVSKATFTGSTSVETVTGTHMEGKSDVDVKQIDFGFDDPVCDKMNFIPQDFHNHFANIVGMYFESCRIPTLTGDELKDYHNLEWIVLRGSPFERIPGNFFKHTPKMKAVAFEKTKITQVGHNLLSNLQDLATVSFFENTCIHEWAENNRTAVLEVIKHLKEKCPDPADSPTCSDEIRNLKADVQSLRQELQSQKDELRFLKITILGASQN